MDDRIITALIALPSAVIGGVISTIIAPWFNYYLNKRVAANDRTLKRYTEVYSPLVGFLIGCHISSVSLSYRDDFQERFARARIQFKRKKYRAAWLNLVRKPLVEESADVEYGAFPLSKIFTHVQNNAHLADPRLLSLVQFADCSKYENQRSDSSLTAEEFELFNHIQAEHTLLAKRFGMPK